MSTSSTGSCTNTNSLTVVQNCFFELWFQSSGVSRISGISMCFTLGWKVGKQHCSVESFAAWYIPTHHSIWHCAAECAKIKHFAVFLHMFPDILLRAMQ